MSKSLTKAQKEAIIYKIKQNREAKVKEVRERLTASFVPTEEQSAILADLTRAKELSDELEVINKRFSSTPFSWYYSHRPTSIDYARKTFIDELVKAEISNDDTEFYQNLNNELELALMTSSEEITAFIERFSTI